MSSIAEQATEDSKLLLEALLEESPKPQGGYTSEAAQPEARPTEATRLELTLSSTAASAPRVSRIQKPIPGGAPSTSTARHPCRLGAAAQSLAHSPGEETPTGRRGGTCRGG